MIILFAILLLIVGMILIWVGSDWMTDSLIPVAKFLGTSYVAVASILVSIMLSIPEIFTSVYSYYMGYLDISLGVIIGSIMCNIGLMTGLSAIIKPLHVDKEMVVRDGFFALVVCAIIFVFGIDLTYESSEGIVLLLLFLPYAMNVWFAEKWRNPEEQKKRLKELEIDLEEIGMGPVRLKPGMITFLFGTTVLLGGSYLFSKSLTMIASQTTIPDMIIGLTLGAIGPSVPNIISAVQGTLKNYKTIAIAETFGSNIFTMLVTLGILITLSPVKITPRILFFDITWMGIMHLLMISFIIKGFLAKESPIIRVEGISLILFYVVLLLVNVFL
ncbi:MAG: sodium:calcium antiporter [Candidatus Woesearchaeota archaeon]